MKQAFRRLAFTAVTASLLALTTCPAGNTDPPPEAMLDMVILNATDDHYIKGVVIYDQNGVDVTANILAVTISPHWRARLVLPVPGPTNVAWGVRIEHGLPDPAPSQPSYDYVVYSATDQDLIALYQHQDKVYDLIHVTVPK